MASSCIQLRSVYAGCALYSDQRCSAQLARAHGRTPARTPAAVLSPTHPEAKPSFNKQRCRSHTTHTHIHSMACARAGAMRGRLTPLCSRQVPSTHIDSLVRPLRWRSRALALRPVGRSRASAPLLPLATCHLPLAACRMPLATCRCAALLRCSPSQVVLRFTTEVTRVNASNAR